MDKPDDIPQDVWDYAEIALKFVPAGDDKAQIASVARAILKAKEDEREACAKICDLAEKQCLEARNKSSVKSELRNLNQGAMTLARDLAAAMRSKPTQC